GIRDGHVTGVQTCALPIFSDEVANDGNLGISNGAAVIANPANGDILAMVGSHNYDDPDGGAVNLATSLRQPGSSIKVVTYSAARSEERRVGKECMSWWVQY